MKKKKIIKGLLLLGWMILIFLFSHQPNSGQTTYNIIEKILPTIQTNSFIESINFILRKSAHFTEYFILAILIASLLKEYTPKQGIIFILSLLFCFSYAITDEYHQLFIPGRTGAIKDIFIDTSGSLLFLIIFILYNQYLKSKIH